MRCNYIILIFDIFIFDKYGKLILKGQIQQASRILIPKLNVVTILYMQFYKSGKIRPMFRLVLSIAAASLYVYVSVYVLLCSSVVFDSLL